MKSIFLKAGVLIAMLGFLVGCTQKATSTHSEQTAELRISESELRTYCPRVQLSNKDSFYTVYEKGGEENPDRIIYRVAIDKITRACRYGDGKITMEVAAAGRVVPGPKFVQKSLTLPIYVRARRGEEMLYAKVHSLSVSTAERGQPAQFLFKDEAVIFEQPNSRNVLVFVGFDQS